MTTSCNAPKNWSKPGAPCTAVTWCLQPVATSRPGSATVPLQSRFPVATKGKLTVADIMRIDADGRSLDGRRPSTETGLHTQIYARFPQARVVLHPAFGKRDGLSLMSSDSLLLRTMEPLRLSQRGHARLQRTYPVFGNDQDIARLAATVDAQPGRALRCARLPYPGHGLHLGRFDGGCPAPRRGL